MKRMIELKGASKDIIKLLQGITTTDVSNPTQRTFYTAFLNNKGRILADSFLFRMNEERMLLSSHDALLPSIHKILLQYKLRNPVHISTVNMAFHWSLEPENAPKSTEDDVIIESRDPRGILPGIWSIGESLPQRIADSSPSSSSPSSSSSSSIYQFQRALLGVAEGMELLEEIPLEMNLDYIHGAISFSKGCYVGQELIARTKYKGVVRKRLVPFISSHVLKNVAEMETFSKQLNITDLMNNIHLGTDHPFASSSSSFSVGAKVELTRTGEELGTVKMVCNGAVGIAKLPLNVLRKDNHVSINGSRILPYMPPWWPDNDPVTGKSIFDGVD